MDAIQSLLSTSLLREKISLCPSHATLALFKPPSQTPIFQPPNACIKSLANPAVSLGNLPNCLANEMEISETNTVAMISPSTWTIQRNWFIYSCDAYDSVLNIDIIYIAVIECVYIFKQNPDFAHNPNFIMQVNTFSSLFSMHVISIFNIKTGEKLFKILLNGNL